MNKANECTCPSGDGSLVHPCPAHPAVEQACWDERKLSDLGNELHNLSCSIVHENEKLAEQIGGIARELWNWPQACAALAQPSPVLPPFAEKVLAKLRRFYDCAEDFESGGVDIGRHWLDLLTQLGLLNRVQRSPALWEISQHGEDLLEAPVAQAQHSVPEGWVQSLPLKDHQPCKPNEDRANGYTIPIYSRPVLVEEALRKLRAVLCDPIGNVVIDGSDGDREEVQRALGMLAAAPGKEGV